MDSNSILGSVVAVACGLLVAAPAHAAGKQGAVQFSLDGSLLKYQNAKATVHPPNNEFTSNADSTTSATTWGPAASGLGVGVGYVATENIILGLRTSYSSFDAGSADVAVLPRFELMFESGASAAFLAAMLGAGSASGTCHHDHPVVGEVRQVQPRARQIAVSVARPAARERACERARECGNSHARAQRQRCNRRAERRRDGRSAGRRTGR